MQSKMDNQERQETVHKTEQRYTKRKTQHRKPKKMSKTIPLNK